MFVYGISIDIGGGCLAFGISMATSINMGCNDEQQHQLKKHCKGTKAKLHINKRYLSIHLKPIIIHLSLYLHALAHTCTSITLLVVLRHTTIQHEQLQVGSWILCHFKKMYYLLISSESGIIYSYLILKNIFSLWINSSIINVKNYRIWSKLSHFFYFHFYLNLIFYNQLIPSLIFFSFSQVLSLKEIRLRKTIKH